MGNGMVNGIGFTIGFTTLLESLPPLLRAGSRVFLKSVSEASVATLHPLPSSMALRPYILFQSWVVGLYVLFQSWVVGRVGSYLRKTSLQFSNWTCWIPWMPWKVSWKLWPHDSGWFTLTDQRFYFFFRWFSSLQAVIQLPYQVPPFWTTLFFLKPHDSGDSVWTADVSQGSFSRWKLQDLLISTVCSGDPRFRPGIWELHSARSLSLCCILPAPTYGINWESVPAVHGLASLQTTYQARRVWYKDVQMGMSENVGLIFPMK